MKKALFILTMMMLFLISCGSKSTDGEGAGAAAAENTVKDESLKVGVVYSTGGLGDNSYNDATKRGLEKAKAELGITYDEYEPKDPNTEAENKLREYAESGDYALIVATGFTMKDALVNVATEFPEQKFVIIDETIEGMPNVASLTFKEHEGSFLAGALAAMMTKSNVVGYVGGAEAPVIQKFEIGFEQGAKYVKPDIKFLPVYIGGTNAFNDPASAKVKAVALIDQGADVIYHASGASGSGVFQAAKDKGIYAIGVDSNQDALVKGTILTSMIKKVDTAVFNSVKEVADGKFEGKVYQYGLKEDGLGITDCEFTKEIIGQENLDKLDEIKGKIVAGEIVVSPTR